MTASDGAPAASGAGHRRPRSRLWLALAAIVLAVVTTVVALVAHRSDNDGLVGPRANYLALGDSVAYGIQPNLDITDGYADLLFELLRRHGSQNLVNMACPGETSESMLRGACRLRFLLKAPYSGSQITGAEEFIKANKGQVSPVTLTIGANDISDALGRDCAENVPRFDAALDRFDRNLDEILGRLSSALNGKGDLFVTTYYNPYQDACPASTQYLRTFNDHIRRIAGRHHAHVVDIFDDFTGKTCDLTWMCSAQRDIHPTTVGYQAIAERFVMSGALGLLGKDLAKQSLEGFDFPKEFRWVIEQALNDQQAVMEFVHTKTCDEIDDKDRWPGCPSTAPLVTRSIQSIRCTIVRPSNRTICAER